MAPSNACIQEPQQTPGPSNNATSQATSGLSSVDQSQAQTIHESSGVLNQSVSALGGAEPPEPPVGPPTSTRPHVPNTSSEGLEPPSNQGHDIAGGAAYQESALGRRGETRPPPRNGSITPTPRDTQSTPAIIDSPTESLRITRGANVRSSRRPKHKRIESDSEDGSGGGSGGDVFAGARTPLQKNRRSGKAGPSRHGKERMLEPFSDEEFSAGMGDQSDVVMRGGSNNAQWQRQHGGVRTFVPVVSVTHRLEEPTRN